MLGLGLGMVMQVLVLAVQNAVDYENLGAATSAATFFRSIGGSFGVAVFGTIFSSQLAGSLPSGAGNAGAVRSNPAQLQQLPGQVREGYVQAFAASLDTVFLAAVPVALLAFALTWLLREVPLRKTVGTSGLGESYAMPKEDSSVKEIERALTMLVSQDSKRRIYERLAQRAGVDLTPAECWLLCRIGDKEPIRFHDLADQLGFDPSEMRPHLRRLEEDGLISHQDEEDHDEHLTLSSKGREVLDRLVEARREALRSC